MAFMAVESLTKQFGSVLALEDVSVTIESGEFVTLLGPSGCGKTTFLRVVAGLERPTRGKIYLDGRCINDLPPNYHQMGLVVQNYALFPHMTVFENVAYGLRIRRLGEGEIDKRVAEALEMVRLPGFEQRHPRQLSGGQQQRCALARAIVIKPRVLLLDEALGALDKNLREEMQVELKQLQQRLGVTTLHVIHDQEEALGMSDRIVVLNQGRVEQFGTPAELYETPQSEFVANFIGDANIFNAQVLGAGPDGTVVARSEEGLSLTLALEDDELLPETRILVIVRPEGVTIQDSRPDQETNAFSGTVEAVVYHGNSAKVVVCMTNERRLLVHEPTLGGLNRGQRQRGQSVWVTWLPMAAQVIRA